MILSSLFPTSSRNKCEILQSAPKVLKILPRPTTPDILPLTQCPLCPFSHHASPHQSNSDFRCLILTLFCGFDQLLHLLDSCWYLSFPPWVFRAIFIELWYRDSFGTAWHLSTLSLFLCPVLNSTKSKRSARAYIYRHHKARDCLPCFPLPATLPSTW